MIFSAPLFLFVFLPGFLVVYLVVPKNCRNLWIVVGSIVFYGWWKVAYLGLILGIAAIAYVAGWVATPGRGTHQRRLWAVRLGIVANLAVLTWFKYSVFLGATFDSLSFAAFGSEARILSLPDIILPIGISFLVFQAISYILDVARGDTPPAPSILSFLTFCLLFPQLIAGPILRYKDMAHQVAHRVQSLDQFAKGVRRFVMGLAMKLLVADSIAPLADRLFALHTPTATEAWLAGLAYSLQLLFDFAGYSAMAIGLGLMLGFQFVENFNAPYSAKSITEFWQRWHISLSNWLRDYLYIPMGGNRAGALKTYRNLILTMVIGGLWHGANWTFVLWGFWHGAIMAVERALGVKQSAPRLPALVSWAMTMILVMIGWVMFRSPTVDHAIAMYRGMLGANGWRVTGEVMMLTSGFEIVMIGVAIALLIPRKTAKKASVRVEYWANAGRPLLLFAMCFVAIQSRSSSPFLYFQF